MRARSSRLRGARGRRPRLRRPAAAVTAFGAVLLAQLTTGAAPASASGLPDGRATYVVSTIEGTTGAMVVRLATYHFSRSSGWRSSGGGTVTEQYWAWRQDAISGADNSRWTKPSSGYITTGCAHACPVRTPYGFQPGASPKVWSGTWYRVSDTEVDIRWSSSLPLERWSLDDEGDGFAGAHLIAAGPNATGWGVGSNAPADRGVSIPTIYDGGWITGPFVENDYGTPTTHRTGGFNPADYSLCSSGRCMQARNVTSSDRRSWYHSYFAADPARDGRKVFWNNQTGAVQQLEDPTAVCISASGGGHTNALLQALDDNGDFVGFVGVEASLNRRAYGQDVVAAYAMLSPSALPSLGD